MNILIYKILVVFITYMDYQEYLLDLSVFLLLLCQEIKDSHLIIGQQSRKVKDLLVNAGPKFVL